MHAIFQMSEKMTRPGFEPGTFSEICQMCYPGHVWQTKLTQRIFLKIPSGVMFESAQKNKFHVMELYETWDT